MPSDPNNSSNIVSVISAISAITAVVSAFLAYLSYRKSLSQFERSQKNNFINESKEKIDKVYIDLSVFIQQFTAEEETQEKRLVRDRIVFSLEALRVDFLSCHVTGAQFDSHFGDISLKISDITFETNFEKNMHDLAIVKSGISNLKSELMVLS